MVFISTYTGTPLFREIRARIPGRNLKVGTKEETM